MVQFTKGRFTVREADSPADVRAAQRLRYRAFVDPDGAGRDADRFDAACRHVLIEETGGGLAACFRVLPIAAGREVSQSYSAQFYDLAPLGAMPGPMLEVGRFCTAPGQQDPDVLRLALGAMARLVDAGGVKMLFGCSSFAGTAPDPYLDAFTWLGAHHLAPARWLPRVRAPRVVHFAPAARGKGDEAGDGAGDGAGDRAGAMRAMPPLLRSYLGLGGRVSDHAVIDAEMNTLHVFTGLEIDRIPAARARVLRAVSA